MNRLLAAIPERDLRRLEPTECRLPRGAPIHVADQVIDRVYFPHDATLSLVTYLTTGQTIETGTVGCEGAVGLFALHGPPLAITNSVVQVAGRVGIIPLQRLREVAAASPDASRVLDSFQMAFASQLLQQIACNATHDANSRCAKWLLMCFDRVAGSSIPVTQEMLAEMLGVARPTVTQALKVLQSTDAIELAYGEVRVRDRQRLQASACECYGVISRRYDKLLPRLHNA